MPLISALGRQRQVDLWELRPASSTKEVPGQPRLSEKPCLKHIYTRACMHVHAHTNTVIINKKREITFIRNDVKTQI